LVLKIVKKPLTDPALIQEMKMEQKRRIEFSLRRLRKSQQKK